MTFYEEMRAEVLRHGAINNPYLDRFETGGLTDEEVRLFAVEFYNFARFFPKILVAQLVNTEDEAVADELTQVLYSELGDGCTKHRHELLYRDFLRSMGIAVHEAMAGAMLPSTRAYIDRMEQLYSSGNHARALGASFGLENMAITMWDHLIPGLEKLCRKRYPEMDMTYFTFHRALESTHEEAMAKAVKAIETAPGLASGRMSVADSRDFRSGMITVLDYLEGFWKGLNYARTQTRGAALDAEEGGSSWTELKGELMKGEHV
jgi:pyrroloquinoline quinone (PQQ) biosynthesis protein C